MAYSVELRQRVLSSIKEGQSKQETARRFDLPYGTVCAWHNLAKQGITTPGTPGPKKIQPVAAYA